MTTRAKPDFSVGGGGMVDPEFIPADVRRELLLHLEKSPLTGEQKKALIQNANDMGQMVMDGELLPAQIQRTQIERVANEARRLLQALNQLSQPARDSLHAHTDYLAYGSRPPVELEQAVKAAIKQPGGSLLATGWDYVEALEKAAEYAAQQYTIDTTTKPEQSRARGFVSMLAEHVRGMTGKPPPKDKASWFACFAACLGEHLALPIGPRVIASGIIAIR